MSNDLNAEFFKLMGWTQHDDCCWLTPNGPQPPELPNPAGDWRDFHKWVVPELMKLVSNEKHKNYIAHTLGLFMLQHKTPVNALRWAMEEIRDE